MNNKTNRFITIPYRLLAFLVLLITACGGGGDEEGGTPTPVPVETTTITTTTTDTTTDPEPAANPTSLDDLTVDADNKLQSAYILKIDIDKGNSDRGYFSLCDDYQAQGSGYAVNFNSCLFRGPLTDGKLTKEIKVANHESLLIAVIWFYEGQAPEFLEWRYVSDSESQIITMN